MTWLLSIMTITVMWLAGSKRREAWMLSIVNQVLWSYWIVSTGQWGLAPMNMAMYLVAARNLRAWRPTTEDQ